MDMDENEEHIEAIKLFIRAAIFSIIATGVCFVTFIGMVVAWILGFI